MIKEAVAKMKDKYYLPELNSESVVISGGGFVGQWDEYIVRTYGCVVHIFEPFMSNMEKIIEHFRGVIPTVYFHLIGLYDYDGLKDFHIYAGKSNSYSTTLRTDKELKEVITINVVRLDTFMRKNNIQKVDLLKLNVEGAEVQILKSLSPSTAKKIKCISFASHEGKVTTQEEHKETLEHLKSIGYKVEPFNEQKHLNRWKCIYEDSNI